MIVRTPRAKVGHRQAPTRVKGPRLKGVGPFAFGAVTAHDLRVAEADRCPLILEADAYGGGTCRDW